MIGTDKLLVASDGTDGALIISDAGTGTPTSGKRLSKIELDTLARMGRNEAAKWVGQSMLFLLSGSRERFYRDGKIVTPELPASGDIETNALNQLCIAMSCIVRAIDLDSATPLDEATAHLRLASEGGLSLADELIEGLIPILQKSVRTSIEASSGD